MRYTIACSTNPGDLAEGVRALMSEGWEPVGGLAIESRNIHPGRVKGNYDIGGTYYYQSMIHRRDRKERAEAVEAERVAFRAQLAGEEIETWWVNVFRLEDGKLHCDKKPFKSEKIARVNFTIELNEEYIGAFPIRLPCATGEGEGGKE